MDSVKEPLLILYSGYVEHEDPLKIECICDNLVRITTVHLQYNLQDHVGDISHVILEIVLEMDSGNS
jgi:hypothetical protein